MSAYAKASLVVVVALSACDRQPTNDKHWLILMPLLERQQVEKPKQLRSSEFWDRRLRPEAEITDPDLIGSTPLMAKLIHCGPKAVTIISNPAGPDTTDMPVRYSVVENGRSNAVESCIRAALPSGFEMKLIN